MFSLNVSASGINSVFCCFNYINCYCRSGNAVLSWQQPVPVVGGASGFWFYLSRVLVRPVLRGPDVALCSFFIHHLKHKQTVWTSTGMNQNHLVLVLVETWRWFISPLQPVTSCFLQEWLVLKVLMGFYSLFLSDWESPNWTQ